MMRRTPLKRGAAQLLRRVPLRNRSLKRMHAMVHRRRLVAELLEQRPWCEVGIAAVCESRAVDVHELLSRGRGGSFLDPANCVCVCRPCHRHVTEHPVEAAASGWQLSRTATEEPKLMGADDLPPGFVPAFEYLRTPDGSVELIHPAGEVILAAIAADAEAPPQCRCMTPTGDGGKPAQCVEPADGPDGRCTRCRNGHRTFGSPE